MVIKDTRRVDSKDFTRISDQIPTISLGSFCFLKKIWEKIAYYSQQIQHQKEAITQDGKLNIHFFIKENLKQYLNLKTSSPLQPFHYAHQLAMKMSECIATVDGIRPKLDHMASLIWATQRHLIKGGNPETNKSPYDEYDKIDRLIVKTILEITAKEPTHSVQNWSTRLKRPCILCMICQATPLSTR